MLERGDRDDLGWLFTLLGETAVAGLVVREGARRLDRRNRAFWELTLGVETGPVAADVPWPLH